MTIVNPPWVLQNRTDHPAVAFRRLAAALIVAPGPCGAQEFQVTQSAVPGMSVQVSAGDAFVQCFNATGGAYHVYNDAAATVTIAAANPSNPRRDLICVRVQDQEQAGVVNAADLFVVQGTPAASPVDPALPAGASYLVLARVTVNAAATQILNASITRLNYNLRTAALGGITVVGSASDRPSSPQSGDFIYEIASARLLVWQGSIWGSPGPVLPSVQSIVSTGPGATSGTTPKVIATVNATFDGTYLQKVTLSWPSIIFSVAGDRFFMELTANGGKIGECIIKAQEAGVSNQGGTMVAFAGLGAGNYPINAQITRISGTGTASVQAGGNQPITLISEAFI